MLSAMVRTTRVRFFSQYRKVFMDQFGAEQQFASEQRSVSKRLCAHPITIRYSLSAKSQNWTLGIRMQSVFNPASGAIGLVN